MNMVYLMESKTTICVAFTSGEQKLSYFSFRLCSDCLLMRKFIWLLKLSLWLMRLRLSLYKLILIYL